MELLSRPILEKITEQLIYKEFSVIIGPRQCGKTSVLKLLQDYLDKQNQSAYYISLEDPQILSRLDSHPEELFSMLPSFKQKIYV
ncbi:MAG TPA: AAA family ATPase, partial [Draconibacterium sp.]|nr:AAA family ATPase [Draconibacterium sp.]